MNTSKTLHVGMMATLAAVAVITGCQRREPETSSSTVIMPPASAPAPSTTAPSPGTPGYVGPSSSESSSQMQSSPGGPGSTAGPSGSSEEPMKKEEQPSGASSQPSPSPSGPSSSLDPADRPFRDVAVASGDGRLGPAGWRALLGVEVVRVADTDRQGDARRSGSGSSGMGMSPANTDQPGDKVTGTGKISKKDRSFIEKAAAGGMFEVEAAKLATDKASDPQLKSFASKMLDQHQQANDELKQIASNKGVTLPTQLPSKEQGMIDRLTKASGKKFDQEYISMVGLRDHREDIRLFENARNETTDSDLKAWIDKTLPALRTHLAEAQQLSGHAGMKMQGYTGPSDKPGKGKAEKSEAGGGSGIGGTGVGGSL